MPVTERAYSLSVGYTGLSESSVRADIDAHPPVMDGPCREGIATDAYRRANLPDWFPRPDDLAEALAIVALRAKIATEGQLAFEDGVVVVRRDARSPLTEQLALFHELAEVLIAPYHHRHGDVWLLALALAIPLNRLEWVDYFRPNVPEWAVDLRLEIAEARAA